MAMSPFDMPMLVNIITEMLFTMKYGIPSAKYRVGIHHHGFMFTLVFIIQKDVIQDNNVPGSHDNRIP